MGTARELITRSFRLLGTHGQSETPSAAEMSDGLSTLIDMLDTWSADGDMIPFRVKDEKVLTAGTGAYTMGAGGDISSSRPSRIISAFIRVGTTEYPMKILDAKEFAEIPLKATQSDIPKYLYAENTSPLETINLYYVPSSANTLVLWSEKPFSTLTLNTTIAFPPGYSKLIRFGLAIDLAAEYGVGVRPEVTRGYEEALQVVENRNKQDQLMDADPLNTGRMYDIYSGEYE